MMTTSIILFLFLQSSVVSGMDQIPSWVDPAARDFAQSAWRQRIAGYSAERLKREYGLIRNHESFECELRYPAYIGSIDFPKIAEGMSLVETLEVLEAYSFSVVCGDSCAARMTVAKYDDDRYRILTEESYGKLIPKSSDLYWQLYQHFGTQSHQKIRFVSIPDAESKVLVVEGDSLIGIFSYDHTSGEIVQHETERYVRKMMEDISEFKKDPDYQQSIAFRDSLWATPEYQKMPKPEKYYWLDAIRRGIVQ